MSDKILDRDEELAKFKIELESLLMTTLQGMWDELMHHSMLSDYRPYLAVYPAAKAVFEELDKRGAAPDTLLFKRSK